MDSFSLIPFKYSWVGEQSNESFFVDLYWTFCKRLYSNISQQFIHQSFYQNTAISIHENAFKTVVYKIAALLFLSQCFNLLNKNLLPYRGNKLQ